AGKAFLRCTDYIRMLMALQFLPTPHIPHAFETLGLRATTDATRRLVAYISRKWPRDWSVFRQDVRSNKDLEVEGSDLHRITTTRSAKVQKSLAKQLNAPPPKFLIICRALTLLRGEGVRSP
ncbi:hypothetical protein DPMN_132922, partial [Dreissena polymorpha]